MNKDWFNGAVSPKPQTVDYLLPRIALTMVQPDHVDVMRGSCHQKTAQALRAMHDEDRLTSDHSVALLGTRSGMVCHSVILHKGDIAYDSMVNIEWANWDAADEIYHTSRGPMIINAKVSIDDFFKDYVEKITMSIPRNPAQYFDLK